MEMMDDCQTPRDGDAVINDSNNKTLLVRDTVLRLIHAAFPGAQLQLPERDEQQEEHDDAIDLDLIAESVRDLAEIVAPLRANTNSEPEIQHQQQQDLASRIAAESVQANQDLIAMCQRLVARLAATENAFDTSSLRRSRSCKLAKRDVLDDGVDLDFLFPRQQQQQQQQQQNKGHHAVVADEPPNDVVTHMRRRIAQLEDERDALAEQCNVLTLQLRGARGTLDSAARRLEGQCARAFEEIAKVHVAIESLASQPLTTTVASVSASTTLDDLLQVQHHHSQQQPQKQESPGDQSQRQQQDDFFDDNNDGRNNKTSPVLDPLDRVYLQSYPALGMGMILQTLAVVFKREFDVMMMGDGGTGLQFAAAASSSPVRRAADNEDGNNNNSDGNDDDNQQQKQRHNDEDINEQQQQPELTEAEHFENACRQFQLALQKDIGPLLTSLSTLQQQMGLLSGSAASIRGDYVTKCLQARIKPNSGVMKALTAVASTDRRRIRALDCSNFLVGDVGLAPLVATVESLYRLERLDLRGNNLHASGVRVLCAMLRRHPSIKEVDLRGNPVGRAGAKLLLTTAAELHRIERVTIDDRAVDQPLLMRLQRELARNHVSQ